jgi:hypothetical protein
VADPQSRQVDVLRAVAELVDARGRSIGFQEVADHLGLEPQIVGVVFQDLFDEGYVRGTPPYRAGGMQGIVMANIDSLTGRGRGVLEEEGTDVPGFKIYPEAIEAMVEEIREEFAKHPIRIPVEADAPTVQGRFGDTHIYQGDGPIIQMSGDHAQLAWGTQGSVHQGGQSQEIAPGFELIAQAVASTLAGLSAAGLDEGDAREAQAAGEEALKEIEAGAPDRSRLRRAVTTLRGYLTPIAMSLASGAGQGTKDWAHTAVEQLTRAITGI